MRRVPRNWRGGEGREDAGGAGGPAGDRGPWAGSGCEQIREVGLAERESGRGRGGGNQLEFERQGDVALLSSGCE